MLGSGFGCFNAALVDPNCSRMPVLETPNAHVVGEVQISSCSERELCKLQPDLEACDENPDVLIVRRWWYEPKLKAGQAPLPPGSLSWPVFGNMGEFLRAFKSDNAESFISRYISKDVYGHVGVYKAFLFRQPTVLATSPEACKFVLCNQNLFEIGWPKRTLDVIGQKTLSAVIGQDHLKLTKITTPAISSTRAILHQMPRIERNTKTMLEDWVCRGEIVVLDEARKFSLKTIHDILVGDVSSLNMKELSNLYHRLNKGLRAIPINFPGTAYHGALKARKDLVKHIQKIFDARKCCSGNSVDTLSLLMEATNEDGKHLDDDQIVNLIIAFLNGGQEAVAHLITWLLIMLNKHPLVYEKAKAEQDAIASQKLPGELVNLSDIRSMSYMSRVIDETLRLVNIAPFGFRETLTDVEFNGYTIPKGWFVETWLRQVHMDPLNHTNPTSFDPDRWINKEPQPNTFIPFGMGSRKCPGSSLAKTQTSIFMHHLIIGYKWEPLNPNYKLRYLPHPRPADHYPVKIKRRME